MSICLPEFGKEKVMAGKWLRNKEDGTIYGWNEILAKNPKCEEVTEEQAFPEKFKPKTQRKRKPKLDLTTETLPEEPSTISEELADEASRDLP
jgi:hypothetical protein